MSEFTSMIQVGDKFVRDTFNGCQIRMDSDLATTADIKYINEDGTATVLFGFKKSIDRIETYPIESFFIKGRGWKLVDRPANLNVKIDRYDLDFHGQHGEDAYMRKDATGEYVLYEDVERIIGKLQAVLDARQKRCEELARQVNTAHETLDKIEKLAGDV